MLAILVFIIVFAIIIIANSDKLKLDNFNQFGNKQDDSENNNQNNKPNDKPLPVKPKWHKPPLPSFSNIAGEGTDWIWQIPRTN